MKQRVTALVMAVGSPLGQSIYKALRASDLELKLLRADIDATAAGFYLDDEATNVVLPLVRDPAYRDALTTCVRQHHVDVIFPVIGVEHEFYAAHPGFAEAEGVAVITPQPGLFALCDDKYGSMVALRDKGLRVPDTALCSDAAELEAFLSRVAFPVVLKPRSGASSVNVFTVRSRAELESLVSAFAPSEFVAQERLPGPDEYTVGVYVSRDRGFTETIVIRRDLKFGLSYKGDVVENRVISDYCRDVCLALDLPYASNVQLRLVEGEPCAFEVNPRLSSTTTVRAHFGFNEPELILRDLFGGLQGHQPAIATGAFLRYWSEHYLDGR